MLQPCELLYFDDNCLVLSTLMFLHSYTKCYQLPACNSTNTTIPVNMLTCKNLYSTKKIRTCIWYCTKLDHYLILLSLGTTHQSRIIKFIFITNQNSLMDVPSQKLYLVFCKTSLLVTSTTCCPAHEWCP